MFHQVSTVENEMSDKISESHFTLFGNKMHHKDLSVPHRRKRLLHQFFG